jgi:hypothetical protein
METTLKTSRTLSPRLSHGRVANAIAGFLNKRLTVPEIYFSPQIPAVFGVDLLAIDHSGSGDAHGVEIKVETILPLPSAIETRLAALRAMPVHYKYLAINAPDAHSPILEKLREYEELFDESGIGRFGVLAFDQALLQSDSIVVAEPIRVVAKPERFLVRGDQYKTLEKFLSKSQPDIRVRI